MDLKRGTPAAMLAAIAGPWFHPVILAEIDWPGAPLFAHSGKGEILHDDRTWQGVGKFGSVDIPEEVMTAVPSEFTMELVSDFPDLEPYTDTVIRGRLGRVLLGATTTPGGNDLIDAVEIITGTADGLVMRVEIEDENGRRRVFYRLTVTMTTGPSMRSAAAIAHSDEDQRRAFPNDTAGRHLILAEATAQKTLWPEP